MTVYRPVAVNGIDVEIFWFIDELKLIYWARLRKRIAVKVVCI